MAMTSMYEQRLANLPVIRYCAFSCTYCKFKRLTKISPCPKCRAGERHSHMEVLARTPPKTSGDQFNSIGLAGDVSFMDIADFQKVLEYCQKWSDRTFMIQSKNPAYFLRFAEIPDNVILATTLETNRLVRVDGICYYAALETVQKRSLAPDSQRRYEAMTALNCKKAITIEPIMKFDLSVMERWIQEINPLFVYIGYDSGNNSLFEPTMEETQELIERLERFTQVRLKLMRSGYEGDRNRHIQH